MRLVINWNVGLITIMMVDFSFVVHLLFICSSLFICPFKAVGTTEVRPESCLNHSRDTSRVDFSRDNMISFATLVFS